MYFIADLLTVSVEIFMPVEKSLGNLRLIYVGNYPYLTTARFSLSVILVPWVWLSVNSRGIMTLLSISEK
jgi:hypothetical protein